MSANFRQLTDDLQVLVNRLEQRCLAAEVRVSELEAQLEQQQTQIAQIEAEKAEIETKYRNLQTAQAASQGDPAEVSRLKEQYLAMVSEIDACITMLQNE